VDEKLINGISFVKSSSNRRQILKTLLSDIKSPAEISNETKIRLNHVSMYLGELKENGLVECLNENAKKGRLYQLTNFGKKVMKISG